MFAAWEDVGFFGSVRRGSHGAIEWGDAIDVCPDAMYLRLTGKTPEKLGLVIEWATLHQGELSGLWDKARRSEALSRVEPLP